MKNLIGQYEKITECEFISKKKGKTKGLKKVYLLKIVDDKVFIIYTDYTLSKCILSNLNPLSFIYDGEEYQLKQTKNTSIYKISDKK